MEKFCLLKVGVSSKYVLSIYFACQDKLDPNSKMIFPEVFMNHIFYLQGILSLLKNGTFQCDEIGHLFDASNAPTVDASWKCIG